MKINERPIADHFLLIVGGIEWWLTGKLLFFFFFLNFLLVFCLFKTFLMLCYLKSVSVVSLFRNNLEVALPVPDGRLRVNPDPGRLRQYYPHFNSMTVVCAQVCLCKIA